MNGSKLYLHDIKVLLNGSDGTWIIGDMLSTDKRDKNVSEKIFQRALHTWRYYGRPTETDAAAFTWSLSAWKLKWILLERKESISSCCYLLMHTCKSLLFISWHNVLLLDVHLRAGLCQGSWNRKCHWISAFNLICSMKCPYIASVCAVERRKVLSKNVST